MNPTASSSSSPSKPSGVHCRDCHCFFLFVLQGASPIVSPGLLINSFPKKKTTFIDSICMESMEGTYRIPPKTQPAWFLGVFLFIDYLLFFYFIFLIFAGVEGERGNGRGLGGWDTDTDRDKGENHRSNSPVHACFCLTGLSVGGTFVRMLTSWG